MDSCTQQDSEYCNCESRCADGYLWFAWAAQCGAEQIHTRRDQQQHSSLKGFEKLKMHFIVALLDQKLHPRFCSLQRCGLVVCSLQVAK